VKPTLSLGLRNFGVGPTDRVTRARLVSRARAAERTGIDRLLVGEHVVMGPEVDAYDGTTPFPTGPTDPWLDPLTVLALVAGTTGRIRLATNILLAPLRNAVVLAKTAATLDAVSDGRFELGVGVGWQRAEYEAAGVPFGRRGRQLDAALERCAELWSGTAEVWCEPRPARPIPLWIAGRATERTLSRVGRFATGWIPWATPDIASLTAGVRAARAAVDRNGRDPASLQVRVPLPLRLRDDDALDVTATIAPVAALIDAGGTDFTLGHPPLPPEPALSETLAEIVDTFRLVRGDG
jgi:probable F420-dependent oxidoreductase